MVAATANRDGRKWGRRGGLALLALMAQAAIAGAGPIQAGAQEGQLQARIWLDRGSDAVYERGDRARVYYHVSESAYVAIFRIDTDGRVDLLYPRSPWEDHYTRGGRDYRLLFDERRSPFWYVDDDPGLGYYFIVASPRPLDFSTLDYGSRGGWDLAAVGRTVYRDPYVAIDEYVARLIPEWDRTPYALDFTEYNVDRIHDYPRFLCYDCHGYRPYRAWNPYRYHCTSFRVVIYNDPYYYPVYRYRGTRVVFVRPPRPRQPRFVFKERAAGEVGGPVVATRGSVREVDVPRRVSPKENGAARVGAPRTVPRADAAPGRSRGTDRVRAPRRPTSPPSTGRGSPRATRDPVVPPRVRPSDRLRGRSGSSGGEARSGSGARPPDVRPGTPPPTRVSPPARQGPATRRSTPPATGRSTPRAGRTDPPVRSAPRARPSTPRTTRPTAPPGARSSPPARSNPPSVKRSKPRVKKRGGGGGPAGVTAPSRQSRGATSRTRSVRSRGSSGGLGSVLGRAIRRVLPGTGTVRARSSGGGRSTGAAVRPPRTTRGSGGTSVRRPTGAGGSSARRARPPTVRRTTGSARSSEGRRSPPRKVRKSRGGGGEGD